MIRTQIQLTEEQSQALKDMSVRKQESISELIRKAVDMLLQSSPDITVEEKRQRAIAATGTLRSGIKDLAVHHDKYLAGGYGQ